MNIHRNQAAKNIRDRIQRDLGLSNEVKSAVDGIIEDELAEWDVFPKGTVLVGDKVDESC